MTEIWLPSSAKIHNQQPTMFCTVITDVDGGKCGKPFYPGEEKNWERHVVACSRRHEAEIRHASLRERMPGFFGAERAGQEEEAWLDRADAAGVTNREKVIQGRKRF